MCGCDYKISGMEDDNMLIRLEPDPVQNGFDAIKGATLIAVGYGGANFITAQAGKYIPQIQSTVAQGAVKTVLAAGTIYFSVTSESYQVEGGILGVGMAFAGIVDLLSAYLPGTVTGYLPAPQAPASIQAVRLPYLTQPSNNQAVQNQQGVRIFS